MIALAIALNQALLLPITNDRIDVIVQQKILDLLNKLRDAYGMALI